MGGRTILVLLGVVGALVAVLYFTSEKPPARTSASASALDGRSLLQCRLFRWQFPDQPAHEIERGDDGVFRLTEPIRDRASSGYTQQIVQAWDSATLLATEYSDDADGRRETGFERPEMTFVAEWPDGHRIEYDVGAPGPLGTDRFLRRDGKIWRGGTGLFESMRVGLDDLRDRQVFRNREIACQELLVEAAAATGKRETIRLKRVNNAWRMLQPFDGRADSASAIQFVTAVLSMRADSFMGGLVRVPERDPDAVVRVRGGLGSEELQLWVEQGAAFGQLPGRTAWFQFDPRTFEAVFRNAVDRLRARTLIGLNDVATELAEVVIDPGQGRGDRVHLLRDSVAAPWRIVEPVEQVTSATPINELVQAINNLRAIEFVDDRKHDEPELGLVAGRLAISVRGFERRETLNLWLGSAAERGDLQLVYACRADEPGTVVLVPAPAVERIKRPWTTYCAKEVVQIPVRIDRVEVARVDGSARRAYRLDGQAGHWIEEGKAGRLDELGEFVDEELRDLVARSVLDMRSGELGEADWVVYLMRGNRDPLQELRAWDRGEGTRVVLQPARLTEVGFEVGARASSQLRSLWK